MTPRRTLLAGLALLAAPLFVACGSSSGVAGIATGDARGALAAPTTPPICARLAAQPSMAPASETAGSSLDTARIQSALDGCGGGRAVELSADGGSGAFVSGPLTLPNGVSLVIDNGVTLYASRQPALYDSPPRKRPDAAHCGQYDGYGKSCRPLIAIARRSSGSGVYGSGVIDGQGGQPILYSSDWGPNPVCQSASMPAGFPTGAMSWWDLANCAGVVDHMPGSATVRQSTPILIEAFDANNLIFSGVTLRNSPHAHLVVEIADNVTIWGIKINTPSGIGSYGMARAHNTDGIDLSNVRNVTVAHAYINDGDDHIAIASRARAPGAPSSNITIADDNLYGGHGISIGSGTSGGIQNVLVENDVVNGGPEARAITAIHIKSNDLIGGSVSRITYRNICIGNVIYPIWLDTGYKKLAGGSKPTYSDIDIDNVSIFADAPRTGRIVFDGSGAERPLQVTLQNVLIDHPAGADSDVSSNVDMTLLGKVDFRPHGDGVAVNAGSATPDRAEQPSAACRSALAAPPPFPIAG